MDRLNSQDVLNWKHKVFTSGFEPILCIINENPKNWPQNVSEIFIILFIHFFFFWGGGGCTLCHQFTNSALYFCFIQVNILLKRADLDLRGLKDDNDGDIDDASSIISNNDDYDNDDGDDDDNYPRNGNNDNNAELQLII